MIRRPPRSTRTDTLFPYTTLFRSDLGRTAAGLEETLRQDPRTLQSALQPRSPEICAILLVHAGADDRRPLRQSAEAVRGSRVLPRGAALVPPHRGADRDARKSG